MVRQLTKSIKNRLPETPSIKDTFDKSLKSYQDALKDSDFSNDFRYVENNNNRNDSKLKQKRKIIWFNPPFCNSFYQNIFLKNHKMNKIF